MATQKVSQNYANARSGKPPVGKIRDAGKAGSTPGFTKPAKPPPEKSHVASKSVKAAFKTAVPEARVASVASRAARPKPRAATRKLTLPSAPRSDKRTSSAVGNHAPVIVAEFILAILIVILMTITSSAKATYQEAMASAMLQLSAITGVFFVLFLFSSGKHGSKAAAWFGVLVDLGILFTAVNKNALADFSSLVQGNGISSGAVTISDTKPAEYYETKQAWVSTSDVTPQ